MTGRRIKQLIISFFIVISVAIAAIPLYSDSSVISNASFGLCKEIGSGMSGKNQVNTDVSADATGTGRKWTVQELFGNSLKFTSYNGEGKEGWLLADTKDRGKKAVDWKNATVQTRVKEIRQIDRCLVGGITTSVNNVALSISSAVMSLASYFVSKMMSSNIICTVGGNTSGCINILGIIGGTGSNGGIIGSLRDSIFSPLATLAFLFAAMWLMYKGLIKREFRTSLVGFLWSIGIFVIGLMAMQKPQMLAAAPQTINSAINTCIIGALNGQNCVTSEVTAPSSLVGTECKSSTNSKKEQASMAANAMTCSIWKSFVLDGWSRAQFGTGYNSLYLASVPSGGEKASVVPKDTSIYGVSLKSSGSASSYKNKTVETSGDKVYNLALYQLYISTNMKTSGDKQYNNKSQDPRWFNIVVPVAKSTDMWDRWAPVYNAGVMRFLSAMGTLFIVIPVAASLILFAFWGMVYMLAGSLLMVFSPFFLLLAIEPSKGRRIFLGWLESVVSSILKFMASSLFVIVALTLYSSVLNSTKSFATSFIGILVMVGVLMMYRKEIVNLLGMSNLGGQRLSNAVGDRISDKAKDAKDFATVVGGSAVGGMIASRNIEGNMRDKIAGTVKHTARGAVEGAARQTRRQQNFAGGVARQIGGSRKAVMRDNEELHKQRAEQAKRESAEREAQESAQGQDSNTPGNNSNPTPPTGGGSPSSSPGSSNNSNEPKLAEEVTKQDDKSNKKESRKVYSRENTQENSRNAGESKQGQEPKFSNSPNFNERENESVEYESEPSEKQVNNEAPPVTKEPSKAKDASPSNQVLPDLDEPQVRDVKIKNTQKGITKITNNGISDGTKIVKSETPSKQVPRRVNKPYSAQTKDDSTPFNLPNIDEPSNTSVQKDMSNETRNRVNEVMKKNSKDAINKARTSSNKHIKIVSSDETTHKTSGSNVLPNLDSDDLK